MKNILGKLAFPKQESGREINVDSGRPLIYICLKKQLVKKLTLIVFGIDIFVGLLDPAILSRVRIVDF